VDLPDIEMSFPEDIAQPEPHIEVDIPVEQTEHTEETREQSLTEQGEENLDTPHKQKTTGKGHNKIKN
jgi:hypothetical protein